MKKLWINNFYQHEHNNIERKRGLALIIVVVIYLCLLPSGRFCGQKVQVPSKKPPRLTIMCFTCIKNNLPHDRNQRYINSYKGTISLHCNENPIYVFLYWELRGFSPNFYIHVSVLWAIYIFQRSVHIFSCSRTDRRLWESLTDTWMWKLDWGPAIPFGEYLVRIIGIVSLQCTVG
jgi:hypothetical protein